MFQGKQKLRKSLLADYPTKNTKGVIQNEIKGH